MTVADRLAPFGTTIFAEMSKLALQSDAVNLGQGFPDFDGPGFVIDAFEQAMRDGHNQYAPMGGVPVLSEAIADRFKHDTGVRYAAADEITVTAGCTEALAATFLGLVNHGDEVILFEPFYDSYRACVALASGMPRYVTLRPGDDGRFGFDPEELAAAFNSRTKAILVNTPHNPTGKVFTRAELEQIAALCIQHDVIAITDEVYERLTFNDDLPHLSLASIPGMRDRTVTLSSLGKTFSFTGWKIGWAIAPRHLTQGVRAAHQFLTYAVSTPAQHAAAAAIRDGDAYVRELRTTYLEGRDYLCDVLKRVGFDTYVPDGTYFVMAGHKAAQRAKLNNEAPWDDRSFAKVLTSAVGVASIPVSYFYSERDRGLEFVRFSFCKTMQTLKAAAERLEATWDIR